MFSNYTPKDEARFWKKVDKSPHPKGCWLWVASTNDGYGQVKWDGTMCFSHRVSYLLAHGDCPDNLLVLHKCDNPRCVNPDHLFLGTHQDNADDKVKKRRQAKGEKSGKSKMTWEKVYEVRRLYSEEGLTLAEIGAILDVTPSNIGYIVRNKTWKDNREQMALF